MRPLAAALTLLAGCSSLEYHPPRWDKPRDALVSTGCLELSAGVMVDGLGKVPGIPLFISFHSTCKEPAPLDLRRVRVLARLDAGPWIPLVPYDPEHAMHPGLLAPDDASDEAIEYQAPSGALGAWSAVCVNFDVVRPEAPVSGAVLCFDPKGAALAIDDSADGGAP